MRLLVKEPCVMSREEVCPTYKIPRWFAHRMVKWRRDV
jgi:hypothetical protein